MAIKQKAKASSKSVIVKGEGPRNAKIMLIGEAPGANEIKLGRPFVGRAGKFLDKALRDAGLDRKKLYITNVVKTRPTKLEDGREKDRKPTLQEVAKFLPILQREIDRIKPKLVVLMGDTACEALLGKKLSEVKGRTIDHGYAKFLCTYHPAGAMRQAMRAREFAWHIRKAAAGMK